MDNIIIDNLEIMALDLPDQMSWYDVDAEIEALGGNGWRLPYNEEFKIIYDLSKLGIGNFKKARYWAYSSYSPDAWYYDLSVGYSPHVSAQNDLYYVRLVRDI